MYHFTVDKLEDSLGVTVITSRRKKNNNISKLSLQFNECVQTPDKTFLMSDEPLPADFALLCAFYSVEYALGNEKVEAVCPEVFSKF